MHGPCCQPCWLTSRGTHLRWSADETFLSQTSGAAAPLESPEKMLTWGGRCRSRTTRRLDRPLLLHSTRICYCPAVLRWSTVALFGSISGRRCWLAGKRTFRHLLTKPLLLKASPPDSSIRSSPPPAQQYHEHYTVPSKHTRERKYQGVEIPGSERTNSKGSKEEN